MEFYRRAPNPPARLGVFPGAFNPVTIAHLALARAALGRVDEVVFVIPREFPHKGYSGASFPARLEMLGAAIAGEPAFSLASSDGGLFIEIAEECRQSYPDGVRLAFLCGRDAAERIVNWDYGRPDAFAAMLQRFSLIVAARGGEYQPPPQFRDAIECLDLGAEYRDVSATEVRRRIACGEPWEGLVPPAVREHARRIYGRTGPC